jgi:hypothetical protein
MLKLMARHARFVLLAMSGTVLAACATGGGMYDQPYALFEAHQRSQIQELEPAIVTAIDGKSRSLGDDNEPVSPGPHRVELSIPGPPGMSNPGRATLQVDAKPCVRYRFGARRSSPTARDWYATVEATEPIGECLKKFPAIKPQQ